MNVSGTKHKIARRVRELLNTLNEKRTDVILHIIFLFLSVVLAYLTFRVNMKLAGLSSVVVFFALVAVLAILTHALVKAIKTLKWLTLIPVLLWFVVVPNLPHTFLRPGMMTNNHVLNLCKGDVGYLSPLLNPHNVLNATLACGIIMFLGKSNFVYYSAIYMLSVLIILILSSYIVFEISRSRLAALVIPTLILSDPFTILTYSVTEYTIISVPFVLLSIFYLMRKEFDFAILTAFAASLPRPELAVSYMVLIPLFYLTYKERSNENKRKYSRFLYYLGYFSLSLVFVSVLAFTFFVYWDPMVIGIEEHSYTKAVQVVLERLSVTIPNSFEHLVMENPILLLGFAGTLFNPASLLYVLLNYVMYNAHHDSLAAVDYRGQYFTGMAGMLKYPPQITVPLLVFGLGILFLLIKTRIKEKRMRSLATLVLLIILTYQPLYVYYFKGDYPVRGIAVHHAFGSRETTLYMLSEINYPPNIPVLDEGSSSSLYLANIPLDQFRPVYRFFIARKGACDVLARKCQNECVIINNRRVTNYPDSRKAVRELIDKASSCGYEVKPLYQELNIYLLRRVS